MWPRLCAIVTWEEYTYVVIVWIDWFRKMLTGEPNCWSGRWSDVRRTIIALCPLWCLLEASVLQPAGKYCDPKPLNPVSSHTNESVVNWPFTQNPSVNTPNRRHLSGTRNARRKAERYVQTIRAQSQLNSIKMTSAAQRIWQERVQWLSYRMDNRGIVVRFLAQTWFFYLLPKISSRAVGSVPIPTQLKKKQEIWG